MNAGRDRTTTKCGPRNTWFTQRCPKWQGRERIFVELGNGYHCEMSCSSYSLFQVNKANTSQNSKLNYCILSKPRIITEYMLENTLSYE